MPALSSRRLLALGLALVFFVWRNFLIWRGWPETGVLADDAFYYFTIAHNLAQGLGPTFDTLAPTNGFHALWLLVITPSYWLFTQDLWTPIRAVLTLSTVLDLASAALLYRLVREEFGARAALSVAAIWLFFPFNFYIALRGMESSLSVFLLLLFFLRLRHVTPQSTRRELAITGVCLGLAGWARLDNLLVGAVTTTAWLWWHHRQAAVRPLLVIAVLAALIISPWLIWNQSQFGHVIPVSGRVKDINPNLFGALSWDFSSAGAGAQSVLLAFTAPLVLPVKFLLGEVLGEGSRWQLWIHAVIWPSAFWAYWSHRGGKHQSWLVLPAAFLISHVLVFGWIGRFYASWYSPAFFAVLLLLVAPAFARPPRALEIASLVWLIGVGTALHFSFAVGLEHGAGGVQRRYDPPLQSSARKLPSGGNLGAFDAGAMGYVALGYPSLRVINIDCLVNNVAFDAYERQRYGHYLVENLQAIMQDVRKARPYVTDEELRRLRIHFGQLKDGD